jgi:threonine dehydrogenase-like Zn-dependent dehydrogenase
MKAVTWRGVGDIGLDDVADPKIKEPTDAIIRITTSAICGTDLHFVRGTMAGMRAGTVLGHEAVGEVVEVGAGVRNFTAGDRVVVGSTVACGSCGYCLQGYYAQCDRANPGGPQAGTTFFGGPQEAGGLNGLQAEYARIPFAHVGMVGLPTTVSDEQAIMASDIFPTAWFGARLAQVSAGDTVAVFGAGPVGQLAVLSAQLQGAGRVIVVDTLPDRLDLARSQHAEVVDFSAEDPVEVIRELTNGIGATRVIDAVGVDAVRPHSGPAAEQADRQETEFDSERQATREDGAGEDGSWVPGDAPSQALRWAVQAVAKAGTIGIIGVYPPTVTSFPIGEAMNRNLTVQGGNCNHRRYIPRLINLMATGAADPARILSRNVALDDIIDAYTEFDRRDPGWIKVAVNAGATSPAGER